MSWVHRLASVMEDAPRAWCPAPSVSNFHLAHSFVRLSGIAGSHVQGVVPVVQLDSCLCPGQQWCSTSSGSVTNTTLRKPSATMGGAGSCDFGSSSSSLFCILCGPWGAVTLPSGNFQ
jgi:hypothetical protein